ncbi:MAG: IPT/TIG domain-containing protein, partial [Blastocatellia bacterium]
MGGRLTPTGEFTPPNGVKFIRSNNVAFSDDGRTGFIGSASGTLYAFDTTTGGQESAQELSGELMGLSVNIAQRAAAVVRRKPSGDEIVVVGFDIVDKSSASSENTAADSKAPPVINSIDPVSANQGQTNKVHLSVQGAGFRPGSVILYNGVVAHTDHVTKKLLATNLPQNLFDQPGEILIQVRNPDGTLSNTAVLQVGSLAISSIQPASVDQGQTQKVHLRVHGDRFKQGSVILYNGTAAKTAQLGRGLLTASLPQTLFDQVGQISIQVREPKGTLSNIVTLQVVSAQTPAINSLSPAEVDGPHAPFELLVKGQNFRETSIIFLANEPVNTVFVSDTRLKTHVPATISKKAQDINVQVVDAAVPGISSNTVQLTIAGPQITELR